jgi:hypothetical protein
LAKGNDRNPCRRGVFRQMMDDINHRPMTHVLIRKCRYHRRHVTNALFLRRCVRL